MIWRIDAKPCNIVDFLDEEGIRGQREGLGRVRVDAEQAEPVGRGTGTAPMLSVLQWVA